TRAGPGCPPSESAAPTPTPSSKKPLAARCRPLVLTHRDLLRPRDPCRGCCPPGVCQRCGSWRGGWTGGASSGRPAAGGGPAGAVSVGRRRTVFEDRAVVVADGHAERMAALAALATGTASPAVVTGTAAGGKLAFLFTGQGAQRAGMGQQMYATYPVFAVAFDTVLAQFDPALREIIRTNPDGLLDQTVHTQPALFAVEVALFRLLESGGLTPDFLVGHSIGELAAAHCAGVLSVEDACRLVTARATLMQAAPAGGGLAAVAAPGEEVAPQSGGRG